MQQKVIPGIDIFLQQADLYKTRQLAIVTNDAAKTSEGILSRVALLKNGFNLVKIFSPEHGISVKGADGVFQNNSTDPVTGLPVISLYGDHLLPTEEELADIDLVLFDIPDVGCRFYTYLWTMTYVMEACAKNQKPLIVLDRPNPIGGDLSKAEGPMLDETNCSSFIGRWSIPIRHSCTLGELARYFSGKKVQGLDLKIIAVKNWHRNQMAGTQGFDFYPTSPAIKNISTALLYPGMGLLEGINVNEGRGTDKPFMQFGAPWIDADDLHEKIVTMNLPGLTATPCSYTPVDSLYKNEKCYGLELTISDQQIFRPVATSIMIIKTLMQQNPAHIQQRLYKTYVNPTGLGHLDKLLGIKDSFAILQTSSSVSSNVPSSWSEEIAPALLYN
jgi:uncharacterized protein YbbC (DUF1343 family)